MPKRNSFEKICYKYCKKLCKNILRNFVRNLTRKFVVSVHAFFQVNKKVYIKSQKFKKVFLQFRQILINDNENRSKIKKL